MEKHLASMEHRTLKSVNNCLNANHYFYLETSGGKSSSLYLNVVHFSTPVLISTAGIAIKIVCFVK
jgi:hypothetical protein